MSEPLDSNSSSKARIPIWLMAVAAVALLIFSLSLGGLTWWLVSRRAVGDTGNVPAPAQRASTRDNPPVDATEPAAATPGETEPGFVALFNGRDLTGWEGDPAVWSVRDGVVTGRTKKQQLATAYSTCLFWRGKELEDFELRFSFQVMGGNNSGVLYRARQLEEFSAGGYQYEILRGGVGRLFEFGKDRTRRDLSRAGRTVSGWHEGAIIVSGQRIIHQLDGEVICDVIDAAESAPRSGWIGLEVAGGPTTVEFKDIRLKKLK
jgi:hypothetical protein